MVDAGWLGKKTGKGFYDYAGIAPRRSARPCSARSAARRTRTTRSSASAATRSSSSSPASASSRRRGEPQEEIPFDEHLLERISTLEDVVKRTAEAVKSLFESLGNLEKNLFVAHTGILALQETLERRGAVRAEEVVDLWESKMDERMQAVEKKDRFLERRDRIIGALLRAPTARTF